MARTESRTKTAIWSDDDFRKLTGGAQRMYWLLYSQPTISLCGVLALTERRWAASASDENLETVRDALRELEIHGYIVVDWDTEEVWVRTFARHDGVSRNNKTFHPAWRQLSNIASADIRHTAEAALRELGVPPDDYEQALSPPEPEPGNRVFPGSSPQGSPQENGLNPCGKPSEEQPGNTSRAGAHAATDSFLLHPSPSSSSRQAAASDLNPPAPTPDDDENARKQDKPDPQRVLTQALTHLAERRLADRETAKGQVTNRGAWTQATVASLRTELAGRIATTDLGAYSDPLLLADWLLPAPAATQRADPLDATQAATNRIYERNDGRRDRPCPTCTGDRFVGPDTALTPCPHCQATGVAP